MLRVKALYALWREIQKAYPELKDVKLALRRGHDKLGSYFPQSRKIVVAREPSDERSKITLIHEAAHALDARVSGWSELAHDERQVVAHDEVFDEINARLREEFLDG